MKKYVPRLIRERKTGGHPISVSFFGLILTFVGLSGCNGGGAISWSSVAIPPTKAVLAPRVEKQTLPSSEPVAVVNTQAPTNAAEKIYHYGRFTIVVREKQQSIMGGVFTPKLPLPQKTVAKHAIFINYTSKELTYYERTKNGYEPKIGYAVVTPTPASLPKAVVRGMVKRINLSPTWCPPHSARQLYPNLPAGCLPFGHPQNAMGVAKFEVNWDTPGLAAVRLHGSNGYPAGNFYEVETLGCTRLENTAILALITKLGPQAVEEGIEVLLLRGEPTDLLSSD